ncbi:hypothetical protein [Pontibacter harenae]|uniref:hypothetical protein n=1 Tax=Pontibacter harenae TaxID=2894083 RepID=UPI001E4AE870|nr:hypothetical protein [Pontibacter harenae]MCC9166226.1 hypothetical protein [Pontibacter harenae]
MLNYSFFEELGLSNTQKLLKYLSLFLDTTPKYLIQLEKAENMGDIKTFQDILYKLKFSLSYFRSNEVNDQLASIKGEQCLEKIRSRFPALKNSVASLIKNVESEKQKLENEI